MTWSKSKNSELLGRVRLSDFAWNSAVPRSSNELSFSAHQSNKVSVEPHSALNLFATTDVCAQSSKIESIPSTKARA